MCPSTDYAFERANETLLLSGVNGTVISGFNSIT